MVVPTTTAVLAQPIGVPVTCCGHQVPTTISFGGSGSGSGSNSGSSHPHHQQQRKSRGRSPQVSSNKGQLIKDLPFDLSPKPRKPRKRKLSGSGSAHLLAPTSAEMFLVQPPYRSCPPTTFEFLVRAQCYQYHTPTNLIIVTIIFRLVVVQLF